MTKAIRILNDFELNAILNSNYETDFNNFNKEDLVRMCSIAKKLLVQENELYKSKLNKIEEYCLNDLKNGRSLDSLFLMGCYDNSKDILKIIKED